TLNNKANFNYKFDCNTAYKIVASMKNYEDNITIINTSKNYNEILNKTLLMEPTIEFITIREQKMIKTNPIYFDLDKDEILLDAAIELEKVIEILNKYPKIKLEIKSHTDSRAPDNYNLSLSEKRASSTINYITSKGISSNRLVGKGYGETQLVNKCSNGIKCTQAEHQLNRRTEFVIIQE
ncbi:OmpA family protein, partial [uncultured Lutibacter sp.]|uniref:OmpA family protein n=1 Tax=uncultured Lutibacter sp. TaxID=437739 RepID=UPI0026196EE5